MTLMCGLSWWTDLMKSGLSWSSKREAQVEQGMSNAIDIEAFVPRCADVLPVAAVAAVTAIAAAAARPTRRAVTRCILALDTGVLPWAARPSPQRPLYKCDTLIFVPRKVNYLWRRLLAALKAAPVGARLGREAPRRPGSKRRGRPHHSPTGRGRRTPARLRSRAPGVQRPPGSSGEAAARASTRPILLGRRAQG